MITIFLLAFLFSLLGYAPPSVLNMTALKIRLNENRKNFTQFTLGVCIIVFLQAFLSIFLIKYLSKNPIVLELLEKVGIIVLFLLSVYFYRQHHKEKKQEVIKSNNKNPFFKGIILSFLNMFAIPFFSGIVAFLMSVNLINFNSISIIIFVLGTAIGAFVMLHFYGKYASIIQQKTGNLTNNIDLFLCIITAVFSVFTLFKLIF